MYLVGFGGDDKQIIFEDRLAVLTPSVFMLTDANQR